MNQPKKYSEIIERIEYLRTLLKLNKSRFSAEIGMKPQTYNNFIGAQASKPNVELIVGIVNSFGANPMWLINGTGSIFLDEEKRQQYAHVPGAGVVGVREGGPPAFSGYSPEAIDQLKGEIKSVEPLLEKVDQQLKRVEVEQMPVIDRYIALIRRYYDVDPISAIEEFKDMLHRIELRIAKPARPENG